MKTELELLKERVKRIEEKQMRCAHEWEEPQEDTKEEDVVETYRVGVDLMFGPTGKTKIVPCFSRVCKKCGKKEYTDKMEEVAVQTVLRPKF